MSDRIFVPNLMAGDTVVITGGSSGLGRCMARQFAGHGANVIIVSRSAERLDRAADEIAKETGVWCATAVCDVRDVEAVAQLQEKATARFGPATIVVNNAGANFAMAARKMSHRAFKSLVDVNLYGTFNVTRAFADDLIAGGRGVVINIVIPEAERGFPGYSHCGAAKAGVVSLTRAWAREWGPAGVRVNAIGAGIVPTEGAAASIPGLVGASQDRIALRRLGTPDDVALTAMFLCSRAANYITGAVINVDGGLNIA
jgi:NAD(P)-dependent dehydrogenase (short-subunit alcohol dehydrogenase family)